MDGAVADDQIDAQGATVRLTRKRSNPLPSLPSAKRSKLIETSDYQHREHSILDSATQLARQRPIVDEYVESSESDEEIAEDKLAALRAGFDPDEMEDFEKEYFPEYVSCAQDYITARNFILYQWKKSPTRVLTWKEVSRNISVRHSVLNCIEHLFVTKRGRNSLPGDRN